MHQSYDYEDRVTSELPSVLYYCCPLPWLESHDKHIIWGLWYWNVTGAPASGTIHILWWPLNMPTFSGSKCLERPILSLAHLFLKNLCTEKFSMGFKMVAWNHIHLNMVADFSQVHLVYIFDSCLSLDFGFDWHCDSEIPHKFYI